MEKKTLSLLILASIGIASIVSITTYLWFLNENKNDDDDDDDDDYDYYKDKDSYYLNTSIINHNYAHPEDLDTIPLDCINTIKSNLHIVYWHTSHGSQLTSGGMANLDEFKGGNGVYTYNDGGSGGALDIEEISDDLTDNTNGFQTTTRSYLNQPSHADVNVVIWSWCGLNTGIASIDEYLSNTNQLELDYPNVRFVYMTGHLDGSGETGAVHRANERIRGYCVSNNKTLYDFADIESYDPDDNYFLNRGADDNCDYDSGNWANQWQNNHPGEWYDCSPAHTQPLNGNLKAYGAWYLFASISGWRANETE